MNKLRRDFFSRASAEVARGLLGKVLVRSSREAEFRGRIVETEAYCGSGDPPSHASSGKTPRSKIMWDKPGLAYVYLVYGIHFMFNVVARPAGLPGAVLVRALEPLEGVTRMKERRGREELLELTNGPGKLAQSFGITRADSGRDLVNSELLWLETGPGKESFKVEASRRIGISKGTEKKLRFFVKESDFVSR